MALGVQRKSTLAIKKEVSEGVDPTIAAGNIIEYTDFSLESSFETTQRPVIRNTKDKLGSIIGAESVAGDIGVELLGSAIIATPTYPYSDPLWEAAMGAKRKGTAHSTTTTGSTPTSVVLTAAGGANFTVGDMILVDMTGSGSYEATWVTTKVTDTLTVAPPLSGAPATGRTVVAACTYYNTLDELPSLWCEYWRGDITKETYKGLKVAGLSIDFAVGQVAVAKFNLEGLAGTVAAGACGLGAGTFSAGNPCIGKNMKITVAGASFDLSSVSFALKNSLYKRQSLITSGVTAIAHTEREYTGSFSLLYENKDVEDAFRASTSSILTIVASDGAAGLVKGNTYGVKFPKVRYTKASKTLDSGIFKYDVTFEAVATVGEDACLMSFC